MIKTSLTILLVGIMQIAGAQTSMDELKPENYFDFWVGNWELTWDEADGKVGKGTNRIERILGEKVIKENFEARSGSMKGFTGKSYSVYNPQSGEWKQTWVDNQGAYLDFEGEINGEKRIFKRKFTTPEGQEVMQRMVFYDIKENSFIWDWEVSQDNGETWQLQWRISYERTEE